jgi:Papain family cysteine protease
VPAPFVVQQLEGGTMARQRRQPAASATTTRRRRRKPQVKRILNVRPSEGTEEDWGFDEATDAAVVAAAPSVPASKDLRATWWRINDQGTTGSCVGWATADSVVRWHFAKAARITRSELLSPRFVWMAAKETDQFNTRPTTFAESEGTSLKAALDITRKFGVIKDPLLPFKSGALYQGDARTLYAIASQLKVLAYFNLGSNLANWRTWIATKGPILTRLDVDDTWQKATNTKGELADYHPNKTVGGHAVALVGYGPDRFVVRNSWGTGWGDKGFAYASLDYAQAAFTEAYGIEI